MHSCSIAIGIPSACNLEWEKQGTTNGDSERELTNLIVPRGDIAAMVDWFLSVSVLMG